MSDQFIYKLNAMERAAWEDNPAQHDYKGKRESVLQHVADLERESAALRAQVEEMRRERDEAKEECEKTKMVLNAAAAKVESRADANAKDAERYRHALKCVEQLTERVNPGTIQEFYVTRLAIRSTKPYSSLNELLDAAISESKL